MSSENSNYEPRGRKPQRDVDPSRRARRKRRTRIRAEANDQANENSGARRSKDTGGSGSDNNSGPHRIAANNKSSGIRYTVRGYNSENNGVSARMELTRTHTLDSQLLAAAVDINEDTTVVEDDGAKNGVSDNAETGVETQAHVLPGPRVVPGPLVAHGTYIVPSPRSIRSMRVEEIGMMPTGAVGARPFSEISPLDIGPPLVALRDLELAHKMSASQSREVVVSKKRVFLDYSPPASPEEA